MKKQWKWVLAVLALVAVLLIATLLYRDLSDRFAPETTASFSAASEKTDAAGQPAAPGDETETDEYAAPAENEPSGEPAADFVVYDRNNTETRLSDHFGKPLVVNFWASWCGPCRSELPAFDAAAENNAGNIEFMMVNLTDGFSETVSSVQSFLEESGYTFPVYFDTDEDAARAYSIYSIPLTVFIRSDGSVMATHTGSMDEATLQGYLSQLLA